MTPRGIRAPILDTIRKSPFEGLLEHSGKIKECVNIWKLAVRSYIEEDYKNFRKLADKVKKLEHQADIIKGNTRNHLPKFIFLPVERGDFLLLLKDADGILDYAEDVVVLMEMRKTKIPADLKDDILKLVDKTYETVETFEKAMDNMKVLLETSFSGKKREETKALIHEVHKHEYESDIIERAISKELFNLKDLDPISVIHLLKIIDRIGDISNKAENASDRIRVMIAK